jgi:hypothetical protein
MKKVILFSLFAAVLAGCKSNNATAVAATKFDNPEQYDASALKGISLDAMHPSPRVLLTEESVLTPAHIDTLKKFKN